MSKYNDKKFYWLQLKEDFFDEDSINWLEEQPNGKEYCLFYLKLCLKSLKTSGIMVRQVGEMLVPYDCKKLSEITNTDVDTVVVAMELLKKIGLIKVLDNGELYLTEVEKMIGSQSIGAFKKQQQRLAGGHSADICPPDIDIELEIEKDIDIEKRIEDNSSDGVKSANVFDIEGPSSKPSSTNEENCTVTRNKSSEEKQTLPLDSAKKKKEFIPPTLDEVIQYSKERNREDLANKFYDYFSVGNWKDSKGQKVKNWKQKFVTWEIHNPTTNNNQQTKIEYKPDKNGVFTAG